MFVRVVEDYSFFVILAVLCFLYFSVAGAASPRYSDILSRFKRKSGSLGSSIPPSTENSPQCVKEEAEAHKWFLKKVTQFKVQFVSSDIDYKRYNTTRNQFREQASVFETEIANLNGLAEGARRKSDILSCNVSRILLP